MEITSMSWVELREELDIIISEYRDAGLSESDIQTAVKELLEMSYDIEEYGK